MRRFHPVMQKGNEETDSMIPNSNANQNGNELLAIEFFAGIGGFAAAWPTLPIAAAIDIHQVAGQIHAANFQSPFWVREIESIDTRELQSLQANLWWLSPPCQPYTTRGNRADLTDARARSLLRLIDLMPQCLPEFIALENVCGFTDSAARDLLLQQLSQLGYRWQSIELCPTRMGWVNKRPRFYLLASRNRPVAAWRELPTYQVLLQDLLQSPDDEQVNAPELAVDTAEVSKFESAMDRYCPSGDPNTERPTACFASSYGRVLLNSGSYLKLASGGYRRFTPREVARMLGYPDSFQLPATVPTRTFWKLLGNSLSLPAVRYVLSHLADGPSPKLPWL